LTAPACSALVGHIQFMLGGSRGTLTTACPLRSNPTSLLRFASRSSARIPSIS